MHVPAPADALVSGVHCAVLRVVPGPAAPHPPMVQDALDTGISLPLSFQRGTNHIEPLQELFFM